MADTKETEISLKVVIDRHKKKVVFAEASSDFVNILFSFLTLPMGMIVRLLANRSYTSPPRVIIGSFNNLYGSVANLDCKYFETKECKDMLLNTRNSAEVQCRNLKINIDDMKPIQYFACESLVCHRNCSRNILSTYSAVKCKNCGSFFKWPLSFIYSTIEDNEGVFLTESLSFVISDDLHVIPNNPTSTLGILKSSGINDFAVLEENTLKLGSIEILDLLECSFLSKTPLSDIFFGKKRVILPVPTIQPRIGTDCTGAKKMTINVFVQKSKNKILLAHTSKDFIDFLFSLLTIPLGKVFSLLARDHDSTLSIENIHQSVLELNVPEYLKSQKLKNMLLNPKLSMNYLCSNLIFPLEEETTSELYFDGNYYLYKHEDIQSPKGEGGFVRGPTKFMVTDDLVVSILSTMSCFTYLNGLKVTPSDIKVQVIDIGKKEALNLLRASLTTRAVLTNGLKFLIVKNPEEETSLNKLKSGRLLKKPKVDK